MTHQKRHILQKIDEIEKFIDVYMELGCGFAPANFYDELYEQIHALETEPALLRHYSSHEEMMMDPRGPVITLDDELPFLCD